MIHVFLSFIPFVVFLEHHLPSQLNVIAVGVALYPFAGANEGEVPIEQVCTTRVRVRVVFAPPPSHLLLTAHPPPLFLTPNPSHQSPLSPLLLLRTSRASGWRYWRTTGADGRAFSRTTGRDMFLAPTSSLRAVPQPEPFFDSNSNSSTRSFLLVSPYVRVRVCVDLFFFPFFSLCVAAVHADPSYARLVPPYSSALLYDTCP